ncbi:hypothetical protein PWY87_33985 [Kribbella solani]|uniref:hypothetical protein n=1 Tax=Kribbella solani TaxID=236067 RepID=UPI0029AA3BEF|nr:hypothetical protein [Kribbella solani]MDX3006727.1 hypothetical protein [Kribbella solani]
MNDQTEIPIEDVPVKKKTDNVPKTPSQQQTHPDDMYQFTVLASLPYRTFDPMCCTKFSAEVWRGIEDDDVYVTYYHASDCEVWRFV